MNKSLADMVFTDPPYGVNYQSNMRTKSEKFEIIKNDDVELDIVPIIKTFSNGWIFIWTTWKVLDKWLNNTKELGFPSNMVIWFKGGGGIGDLKKTFSNINKKIESIVKMTHIVCQNKILPCQPERMSYTKS
jgi:hypothetical protein